MKWREARLCDLTLSSKSYYEIILNNIEYIEGAKRHVRTK